MSACLPARSNLPARAGPSIATAVQTTHPEINPLTRGSLRHQHATGRTQPTAMTGQLDVAAQRFATSTRHSGPEPTPWVAAKLPRLIANDTLSRLFRYRSRSPSGTSPKVAA